jgi:hypothetical protein
MEMLIIRHTPYQFHLDMIYFVHTIAILRYKIRIQSNNTRMLLQMDIHITFILMDYHPVIKVKQSACYPCLLFGLFKTLYLLTIGSNRFVLMLRSFFLVKQLVLITGVAYPLEIRGRI